MAISSTDPKVLAGLAKCFACLTPQQQQAVTNYLLATIAGLPTNAAGVDAIAAAAKCFMCLESGQQMAVSNYILAQIGS